MKKYSIYNSNNISLYILIYYNAKQNCNIGRPEFDSENLQKKKKKKKKKILVNINLFHIENNNLVDSQIRHSNDVQLRLYYSQISLVRQWLLQRKISD